MNKSIILVLLIYLGLMAQCVNSSRSDQPFVHPGMLQSYHDLELMKKKVNAGADYVVTQMFYDNQKYFDFVKGCRNIGIEVPIIPGLKPITTLKDLAMLPKVFNIDIPEVLVKELSKCKTDEEAFQVGIEWGIEQSKELKKFGVPAIHYFTIGVSDSIKAIAKEIF